MIFDDSGLFSDQQSLVGPAGVVYSTNAVPLGNSIRDIGQGRPLYAHIHMHTEITGGGDTTLAVAVALDIQETFPTTSELYVAQSHLFNFLFLSAPGDFCVPIAGPQPSIYSSLLAPRYTHMRLAYRLGGATAISVGVVSARLTLDPVGYRVMLADAVN